MGNEAGSLKRWYRRTVLLIWPSWSKYTIKHAAVNGFKKACEDFLEVTDAKEQRGIAEHVLWKASSDPKLAAKTLCELANRLKDVGLWERAVKECAPRTALSTVDEQTKLWSIEHFGFDALKESFEIMLNHEKHSSKKLKFLNNLGGAEPWEPLETDAEREAAEHRAVRTWAELKKEEVLKNLVKPTVGECSVLLKALHGK